MPNPVTEKIIAKQKEFAAAVVDAKKEKDEFVKQFAEAQKVNMKFWNETVKKAATTAQDLQTKLGNGLKEMEEMIKMSEKLGAEYDMAYRKLVDAERYLKESQENTAEAKKKADADKNNKDLAMKSEMAAKALVKAKKAYDDAAALCQTIDQQASRPLMFFGSWEKQQFDERCIKLRDALHDLDMSVRKQENGWR